MVKSCIALSHAKILAWKHSADDTLNVTQIIKFDNQKGVENIVGKEENGDYQHFLLFLQCFQQAFFAGLLSLRTMW